MSQADLQREKLLQAIVFFVKNTRFCHKLKLFKLLFYLDINIFRTTGRSVTGLDYFAWPMGPVPRKLFEELEAPAVDMKRVVAVQNGADIDADFGSRCLIFKPHVGFDDGCFSTRELNEMARLAEVFRDADGRTMSDVSHARGEPWTQVFKVEGRPQALISYRLALAAPGSISKERADEIEAEILEAAAFVR